MSILTPLLSLLIIWLADVLRKIHFLFFAIFQGSAQCTHTTVQNYYT